MSRSKIVFLDAYTLNHGDLDWSGLKALGDVDIYDRSPAETVVSRASEAEIIITNKVIFDRELFERLPKLKYICIAATGYNNIDTETARNKRIRVSNVVGYSTSSVTQHVFALLLALVNRTETYNREVHTGKWADGPDFSYWNEPIQELSGMTMGIYGFGKIGRAVASVAMAFGMKVISVHKHPERDQRAGVRFVDWDSLLKESDVLSLHAPLTAANKGLFGKEVFSKMKKSAFLINTSRGPVVDEEDLALALRTGEIAGAGLDVLGLEPPARDNPLFGLPNCLITPHHAWASQAARKRLLIGLIENIRAFQSGHPINLVCGH